MHLPAVPDRKMVGQDLLANENEAVFAEMAVRRGVVDIFDDVVIFAVPRFEKIRQRGEIIEFLEIVAAMRACRPGQHGA